MAGREAATFPTFTQDRHCEVMTALFPTNLKKVSVALSSLLKRQLPGVDGGGCKPKTPPTVKAS